MSCHEYQPAVRFSIGFMSAIKQDPPQTSLGNTKYKTKLCLPYSTPSRAVSARPRTCWRDYIQAVGLGMFWDPQEDTEIGTWVDFLKILERRCFLFEVKEEK